MSIIDKLLNSDSREENFERETIEKRKSIPIKEDTIRLTSSKEISVKYNRKNKNTESIFYYSIDNIDKSDFTIKWKPYNINIKNDSFEKEKEVYKRNIEYIEEEKIATIEVDIVYSFDINGGRNIRVKNFNVDSVNISKQLSGSDNNNDV